MVAAGGDVFPEGSRESRLWDGWLESLMILRAFLTPPGVDVLEGGKFTSNNVAGSSHDPLQSFAVASSAVSKAGGDAAGPSRSGCSPQCRCRMIWGCWGLFQTSSAISGRRGADVPSSALRLWADHVRSSVMWTPRNLKLLTRSTGVLSMAMQINTLTLMNQVEDSLMSEMPNRDARDQINEWIARIKVCRKYLYLFSFLMLKKLVFHTGHAKGYGKWCKVSLNHSNAILSRII